MRVTVDVTLAGAVVPAKVDVGFGDAVTPAPVEMVWHDLLGFPEARLLTYPPETVIAEKLNAAEELGIDNSRMKDFFDLDWLCRNQDFDYSTLGTAIRATFARRGTRLPQTMPIALTMEFANDPGKLLQWNAFLRKNRLESGHLSEVIPRLSAFFNPVLFPPPNSQITFWQPDIGWHQKKNHFRQDRT
ncbi:MAG: nucleotidyl transferase AbiEii/AbiGii toxin family protein [Terrimicrobiaceae bacterium]